MKFPTLKKQKSTDNKFKKTKTSRKEAIRR
jgi:hypothetical protein